MPSQHDEILRQHGFDPAKYELDPSTGDVYEREAPSAGRAAFVGAERGLGGLAGFMAGAPVGAEFGAMLGAPAGPLGAGIGSALGGLAFGVYGASRMDKLRDKILSEDVQKEQAAAMAAHPTVSGLAELAPQLAAFKFEPGKNLKALAAIGALGQEANPETIGAGVNALLGTGLAGKSVYDQYQATGQVDPATALASVLLGVGSGGHRFGPEAVVPKGPDLARARDLQAEVTKEQRDADAAAEEKRQQETSKLQVAIEKATGVRRAPGKTGADSAVAILEAEYGPKLKEALNAGDEKTPEISQLQATLEQLTGVRRSPAGVHTAAEYVESLLGKQAEVPLEQLAEHPDIASRIFSARSEGQLEGPGGFTTPNATEPLSGAAQYEGLAEATRFAKRAERQAAEAAKAERAKRIADIVAKNKAERELAEKVRIAAEREQNELLTAQIQNEGKAENPELLAFRRMQQDKRGPTAMQKLVEKGARGYEPGEAPNEKTQRDLEEMRLVRELKAKEQAIHEHELNEGSEENAPPELTSSEREVLNRYEARRKGNPDIKYSLTETPEDSTEGLLRETAEDKLKPLLKDLDSSWEALHEGIAERAGVDLRSTLGEYLKMLYTEKPSSFAYKPYEARGKTFRHLNAAALYAKGEPVTYTEQALQGHSGVLDSIKNALESTNLPKAKIKDALEFAKIHREYVAQKDIRELEGRAKTIQKQPPKGNWWGKEEFERALKEGNKFSLAEPYKDAMTQADLDEAVRIAAARGNKLTIERLPSGVDAVWEADADGNRIKLGTYSAKSGSAAHEFVHDVYGNRANKRVKAEAVKALPLDEATRALYESKGVPLPTEEGAAQDIGKNWREMKGGAGDYLRALRSQFRALTGRGLSSEQARSWLKVAIEHGRSEAGGGEGEKKAYAFVGVNGATKEELWSLWEAKKLIASGASEREAFLKTGWYKTEIDGKWRLFKENKMHPSEVEKRYGTKPKFEKLLEDFNGASGLYDPSTDTIKASSDDPNDPTYAHELQHAIGYREGFTYGGNPQSPLQGHEEMAKRSERAKRRLSEIFSGKKSTEIIPNVNYELYRSFPGEREAFASQLPHSKDTLAASNDFFDPETGKTAYSLTLSPQVHADAFKKWFGGSKVVDEKGNPKILYHGTPGDFNEFKQSKEGVLGNGIYLTDNPEVASGYSTDSAFGEKHKSGSNVKPLYARLRNPLEVKGSGKFQQSVDVLMRLGMSKDKAMDFVEKAFEKKGNLTKEISSRLQKLGHDGIIFTHPNGNNEYVVYNATDVKSATGNTGEYNRFNPDIRYSLTLPFQNEIKTVEQKTGDKEFAGGLTELFARLRGEIGKRSEFAKALEGAAGQKAFDVMRQEDLRGVSLRGTITDKEVLKRYDAARADLKKQNDEATAAGQLLPGTRQRRTDPFYLPQVRAEDYAERLKAPGMKEKFVRNLMDQGLSAEDANQQWLDAHKARETSLTGATVFGPLRKESGYKELPELLEPNASKAARSFVTNWSRGRAWHDVVEKDPVMAAKMGLDQTADGKAIDPAVLAANPALTQSPELQHVMRHFTGRLHNTHETLAQAGRAASALVTANPVAKAIDAVQTPFGFLKFLQPQHYGAVAEGLRKSFTPQAIEASYRTGLNRQGDTIVNRQLRGTLDAVSHGLDKITEGMLKFSGAEAGERGARVMAQSIGTTVAEVAKRAALGGSKHYTELLEGIDKNWRSTSTEELGARLAEEVQGKYDPRGLSASTTEGPLSPFLRLMSWNISQGNTFVNYTAKQAAKGNFTPALGTILAALGSGLAIDKIRELTNPRKQSVATWKELAAGQDQPGYEKELAAKLSSYVAQTGVIGLYGEFLKGLVNVASKRPGLEGTISSPLFNSVANTTQIIEAAVQAIQDGEDAGLVIKRASKDIATEHVTLARLVLDRLDAKDVKENNLSRDVKEWKRMAGMEIPASEKPAFDYSQATKREFNRAETLEESAALLPQMIQRVVTTSRDPIELRRKLQNLASASGAAVPSLERDPLRFVQFLKFKDDPAAIGELLRRENLGKIRREMVPKF